MIDHVTILPGRIKRSLSLTSLDLYEKTVQAKAEWENADGVMNKHFAFNKMQAAQNNFMARKVHTQATNVATYVAEKPLHAAGYVAGGSLLAGSVVVGLVSGGTALPVAAGLGAAGSTLIELTNKDFSVNTGQDALDLGAAAVLGGIPAAKSLKVVLPTAAVVGGYGFATDQSHLMYGAGLAAGLRVALKVLNWGV